MIRCFHVEGGIDSPAGFFAAWMVLFLTCAGCTNAPPTELGVWSEFLPYHEVQLHLPVLKEFSADVYVAIDPDRLGEEFWQLLRTAEDSGVGVRPWLQLPDDGIWLNEQNIQGFCSFARAFLRQADENGVEIDWLVFDLEPHFDYLQMISSLSGAGDFLGAVGTFADHHESGSFRESTEMIRGLVEEVQAQDISVMAVTLPLVVDDLVDGDATWQDILDIPFSEIPWDQVSIMAYRPVFSDLFGVRLTPGFVGSYSESARIFLGPDTQIAIGNISSPGLLAPPGYTDPGDVVLDVTAAMNAGISSISLFSLDGMVLEGPPRRWLAAATSVTARVRFVDPFTNFIRFFFLGVDLVVD